MSESTSRMESPLIRVGVFAMGALSLWGGLNAYGTAENLANRGGDNIVQKAGSVAVGHLTEVLLPNIRPDGPVNPYAGTILLGDFFAATGIGFMGASGPSIRRKK